MSVILDNDYYYNTKGIDNLEAINELMVRDILDLTSDLRIGRKTLKELTEELIPKDHGNCKYVSINQPGKPLDTSKVKGIFDNIIRKSDNLIEKKAFLFNYECFGVESHEIKAAFADFTSIAEDYETLYGA
jgi:Glu-tRNA(Gln) amidotransferase subunit E-like FAD-binding protein